MDSSSAWELSKENVQPLRQGRRVSSLTSALEHTAIDMQHIKQDRDTFEKQLRLYQGDDPLEIWDRYIKWTEQNFPRGGKDGNLTGLLERCLKLFKDNDGYKNDPRFVGIWIKFASLIDDPLEIYAFMFDQNIGSAVAALYEEWASFLERLGNTKKADQIYLEGIRRGAEPLDVLKYRHQEFQIRVARVISHGATAEIGDALEEQRTVLGHLQADKKHRIGTTRTGLVKIGAGRSLGGSQSTSHCNAQVAPTQNMQVFQDENQAPTLTQTGEWKTVPCREQTNRENDLAPDIWTKARVHQRKGIVSASTGAAPVFTVYEDQGLVETPRAPVLDNYALNSRKIDKGVQLLDPICKNESSNVERPAYCKDKIYCGTQEFSFEEIRALKVMECRRQKKLKEERDLMEKQLAEMRLIRDQMRMDMEKMKEEAWLLNQRQPGATHCMQLQTSAVGASAESSTSSSFAKMDLPALCLAPTVSCQSLVTTTCPGAPLRHPSNQMTPVCGMMASAESMSSSASGAQLSLHLSHSNGQTPENNISKQSWPLLSPTINTKEALQMVQGMYNATLDCEKMTWMQEDITESRGAPQSAAMVIYDESKQNPSTSSIPIFCDQENRFMQGAVCQKEANGPVQKCSEMRNAPDEKVVLSALSSRTSQIGQCRREELMHEGTEFYNNVTLTLAPVGSQDSFSAAARLASTPFGISSNSSHCLPAFPVSSIKPVVLEEEHEKARGRDGLVEAQQSVTTYSDLPCDQHHTFLGCHNTPSKKHLSPITEGSTEGSCEESKSHGMSSCGGSHAFLSSLSKTAQCDSHRGLGSMTNFHEYVHEIGEQHTIDTSAYIPSEVKAGALLSASVCLDMHNPFDETNIKRLLSCIEPPISSRANYVACRQHVPDFSSCHFINLGEDTYQLAGLIGEGGYAKVYRATNFGTNFDDLSDDEMDSPPCVIKVQKPAAPWEFYICSVIHQRLSELNMSVNMHPSMQEITRGYFYEDGSCLVSNFCPFGSLLSLANSLKHDKKLLADLEPLAAFLTVQLLNIVHSLHRCHIIHGDIKPDNILLLQLPQVSACGDVNTVFGHQGQVLQLVDFGQAVDMLLYPAGTTFLAKVRTSGFQCIEMMTDRPWTFQTDMFGLAGSLHVLIFGQYMKVYSSQGHWHITCSFQRKWKVELWKKLFHQLLNVPDCDHQPDLLALSHQFQQHFVDNLVRDFRPLLARVTAVCQTDSL